MANAPGSCVFVSFSLTRVGHCGGCETSRRLTHSAALVGNCKILSAIATPVHVATWNLGGFLNVCVFIL